jgi:hypothetical protein
MLILIIYVKTSAKSVAIQATQTYAIPEDGQELRPKHAIAITSQ